MRRLLDWILRRPPAVVLWRCSTCGFYEHDAREELTAECVSGQRRRACSWERYTARPS